MVSKYRNVFLRAFFSPNKTRMESNFSSEMSGFDSMSSSCSMLVSYCDNASLHPEIIVSHAFVSFSSEMGSEINSHALFRNKASNKNASEPWMFNNLLKMRKFGSGSSYAFKKNVGSSPPPMICWLKSQMSILSSLFTSFSGIPIRNS